MKAADEGGKRMLAKAQTCVVIGLDGALVEVEVDIGHGLPAFAIVGLPDAAVNEAKERVWAAIKNSGSIFPLRRITVNLAPADLRKAGPTYDLLPLALGILLASEQVAPLSASGGVGVVEDCLFLGDLSLDGGLRHTLGILSMVSLARELGLGAAFVPAVDAPEAALVEDVTVYLLDNLAQLVSQLLCWPSVTSRETDSAATGRSRGHLDTCSSLCGYCASEHLSA